MHEIEGTSHIPIHSYAEHVALVSRNELQDDLDEIDDHEHDHERPLHRRSRSGSDSGSGDWLPVERPGQKPGYKSLSTMEYSEDT